MDRSQFALADVRRFDDRVGDVSSSDSVEVGALDAEDESFTSDLRD